jgi:hypothetical protein
MGARRAVFAFAAIAGLIVALEVRAVLRSEQAVRREGATPPQDAAGVPTRLAPGVVKPNADASTTADAWHRAWSWSSGPTGLGRLARAEGNAEGPASIAVSPIGSALVVDNVNHRLVFTGAAGETRDVPSPLALPFDATALPNGSFAVLDRLVDKAVAIVDAQGKLLAKIPLGPAAGEPGLLTGVFAGATAVCVEKEHGACSPIATAEGAPTSETGDLPGRPASDGVSILHAGIVAAPSARVHLTRSIAKPFRHGYSKELAFEGRVRAVVFLDANDVGELYLGVVLDAAPERTLVLCLATETGLELGRTAVPSSPLPDEVTRELAVVPSGGFLHLHRTVDGADLRRYPCSP